MPRKPNEGKYRAAAIGAGWFLIIDLKQGIRRGWPRPNDTPVAEELFARLSSLSRRINLPPRQRFIVVEFLECTIERITPHMSGVNERLREGLREAARRWRGGLCEFTDRIPVVDSHPEIGTCAVRLAVLDETSDVERFLEVCVEQEKAKKSASRKERIRELLDRQPSPFFEKEYAAAEELSHLVRLELIERLREPFNAALRARPHEKYEDKKETAKWANDMLRRVSLSVRCPVTGEPAFLIGAPDPRGKPHGAFRLEVAGAEGERYRPTKRFNELIDFELTESRPRRQWNQREIPGPQRRG